ncbi:MAG: SIMPL domain-containing protein [Pseudomonadota bacterium]|mgnify:CR=1 FL=1|jgi:predicted secreted protein
MHDIRIPSLASGLFVSLALMGLPSQAQSPSSGAMAHAAMPAASSQVLHLSASAQTEVPQDWLVMVLSLQRDGLHAPSVQKQLNTVLAAALATATPQIRPGSVEVSTGEMNVSPRYGRDGKISGWQGSSQLVLQGRDAVQIATLAGQLTDLAVSQIDWRLSSEQKKAAETHIQAEAVERFQSKAQALTKQFGFASYLLKEVRVSAQETSEGVMPRRVSMAQMDAPSASPVPTLAGKALVVVNISGSIQLQ